MEVSIISRDTIKPASSSPLHDLKPHKLSIFDQLTPITYVPMVFFYPKTTDPNHNIINIPQTLINLKKSFFETLILYYPLAGRIKNNLYIDDFNTGVPYLEAQVKCPMYEFLKLRETELLNQLIPFHPFQKETDDSEKLPLIAIQVNMFSCGGLALGVSSCHKIFDGETGNAFLKSWAAVSRGSREKIIHPNFSQASLTFPPRDPLPQKYLDLMDSLWFKENNFVTRRFVFDVKSIATLQAKAKSEQVPKPTRVEALTCFLWKHKMVASQALSGSLKSSIVAHAVNIRPRIKPQMSPNVMGNVFWWAPAMADISADKTPELCSLVKLLNESLKEFNSDYLETLQGEEGFGGIFDYLNLIEEMLSSDSIEVYGFTSWTVIFKGLDFGWGRPFWIGVMGKVGPAFRNLTVFVETQYWSKGIEAWVTLDAKQMAILEKDPQFLAFASPNPLNISSA